MTSISVDPDVVLHLINSIIPFVRQGYNMNRFLFVCLNHINVPVLVHAGHVETYRNMLTGHDALLLWQIARDHLHALSHRHDDTWIAFVEPVGSTGWSKAMTRG